MKHRILLNSLRKRVMGLVALSSLFVYRSDAQCTATTASTPINVNTTWQTISSTSVVYHQFTAIAGCQYTFTYCSNGGSYSGDPYLTLTDLSNNPLAWNDDNCGLGSQLNWTCTSTGQYRIHNTNFGCGGAVYTRTLAYWSSCNPVCSGQPTAGAATATKTNYLCQATPSLNLPTVMVSDSMQFQWQVRPVGGTTWTNQSGILATPAYTVTTPITSSYQYRCWVKCLPSNLTDTSSPVTITVTANQLTPNTTTALCTPPNDQPLTISAPPLPDTLFSENFNGTSHSMSVTTSSNAAGTGWIKSTSGSQYDNQSTGLTFTSGSGDFMITYMYTNNTSSQTFMQTPSFSTMGYTTLNLSYRTSWYYGTTSWPSRVEVSTNGGTSWTPVGNSYGGTQVGAYNNFTTITVNLASYLNQADVRLRFYSDYGQYQYWSRTWAVDDIVITGAHPPLAYSWTAVPSTGAGLPTGAGTPSLGNASIIANPSPGSYVYTANITGQAPGCPSTMPVTINVGPKPSSTISGDATICNGGTTPLTVNLAGAPPYQLIYSDGTDQDTLNNITTTSVTIPVSPSQSSVYSIVGLATPV
ncbi:MAG: hypothetical protein JNL72_03515, partial [Flavipsychrobacter sp.]|nr:hypothetical protein [Flavipsychrobacter sp.]